MVSDAQLLSKDTLGTPRVTTRMRARQTARADWCAVERAASCWPGREGGGKLASKGGDRTLELVSSSSPPPGAGGEWHRPVGISSPSCSLPRSRQLRRQDIWAGRGEVSLVAKWRWGGIGEERLMGCLRRLRGLCNVQMCKLCSMMMILGPTAPSIIVQRCIQPRSRKDKRFLMNLIALAKVLTILMSISIKLI